jgi:hypothetical protein
MVESRILIVYTNGCQLSNLEHILRFIEAIEFYSSMEYEDLEILDLLEEYGIEDAENE